MQKEIPKRNYLVSMLIVICTITTTFYFAHWYKISREYRQENQIPTYIKKILIKDLDEYIIENPNIIFYVSKEENEYGELQKKTLSNPDISKKITYVSIKKITEKDYKKINSIIPEEIDIMENPINLIVIENGLYKRILYQKQADPKEVDINLFVEKE